jgi:hypothetical protein
MDVVAVRVAEPLRFLLPLPDRQDGLRRLRFGPDATVGHLVQAACVPLNEAGRSSSTVHARRIDRLIASSAEKSPRRP